MMKLFTRILFIGALSAFALSACGEEEVTDPTAKAIKERQSNFKKMGAAFKSIDDQFKSSEPDLEVIRTSVQTTYDLAQKLPDWFEPGTGPDSGFKTDAKPEIWAEPDKFDLVYNNFMGDVENLLAASTEGNLSQIQAQYFTVGVACSNCHKPFRVDKD